MNDVTQLLQQIEQGDASAAEQLLSLLYEELRKLARAQMAYERLEHTLQGTALVHEAYLRLFQPTQPPNWSSRGHFFAAAAEAMRRVLIDHARQRNAEKRSPDKASDPHEPWKSEAAISLEELLDFNELLVRLEKSSPQTAELVKLRVFAGLSMDDAAKLLDIPLRSAYRDWSFAQAWLFRQLNPGSE